MQVPKSKKVSAVALFVALAVVLNLTIKIPAPYAPFLIYEIWEIPIVASFLVFGPSVGVTVAVLNFLALELIPGILPIGPLYNLVAILSMLLGIRIGHRITVSARRRVSGVVAGATLLGGLVRVVLMTLMNATLLPLPYPLGFNIPSQALPGLLGLIGIFNATISLYTVPLSYGLVKAVSSRYRVGLAFPLSGSSVNS
ncbi:MAG: ECF transporter S component [Thaumarchaeota archaeon]|nr:ECF transporter S component [Nitrososphaerota archaeon]